MSPTLHEFIQSNPDSREQKRAIAVKMSLQGLKHHQIQDSLGVSSGFISKWTQNYSQRGVPGLKLAHLGSCGFLTADQRLAILTWLNSRNSWSLSELQDHIQEQYGVRFKSKQSYYDLFHEAGISWKKTQKRKPKMDPELVKKKEELEAWLEVNRSEIESGQLIVFFQDECHLLWGDLCGYVWGKTNQRIEIPIVNRLVALSGIIAAMSFRLPYAQHPTSHQ